MKQILVIFVAFAVLLSACGSSQNISPINTATPIPARTQPSPTEPPEAIPTFTPLPGGCATPTPDELNDFVNQSITIKDNGKTFVAHVTRRFWIYLDDRTYPLQELLNAIPKGLIGYVSNGSIRGPQCYPVMFEAIKEGEGTLQIKDFRLSIVVHNNASESPIPLP